MELLKIKDQEIMMQKDNDRSDDSDSCYGIAKKLSKNNLDSLISKIEKIEKERDDAIQYSKELERELCQTKEDLENNKIHLIEPLKNRLVGIEQLIQEKEQKVRRTYRRKLRKCK